MKKAFSFLFIMLIALSALAQKPVSNYKYSLNSGYEEFKSAADACVNKLKAWNEGLNHHSTSWVDHVYSDVAFYYSDCMERNDIKQNFNSFFKKYPDYYQYIDDVKVDVVNENHVEIRFSKHVITAPGAEVKTYPSYLVFDYMDDMVSVKKESDDVTDANLAKRKNKVLKIDNSTPLSAIFNAQNVGKYLDSGYWQLVGFDGDAKEGPLAKKLMETGFARTDIKGTIKRNYHGKTGLYACGGHVAGGQSGWYVIFTYDSNTGKFNVIGNQ